MLSEKLNFKLDVYYRVSAKQTGKLIDDYHKYSDEELIGLMQNQNDERAFTEVYQRYVRPLFQTSFRKTGDREVAEDMVQELFVRLWVNRSRILLRKSFRVYIFSALKKKVISHYYESQAVSSSEIDLEFSDNSTVQQIQLNSLNENYEQSLQKLPEKCREVFLMSRTGHSMKEIAERLHISEKTVENHIGKALRILRVELKDYRLIIMLIVGLS